MELFLEKLIELVETITEGDTKLQLALIAMFFISVSVYKFIKYRKVKYLEIVFSSNTQIDLEMNKNMLITFYAIFLGIFGAALASVTLHSEISSQGTYTKHYYTFILFLVLVFQIVGQKKKKLLNGFKENIIFFIPITVTYSTIILALYFNINITSKLGAFISISIIILIYFISWLYFSPIKGKQIQYAKIFIRDSNKTYAVLYKDVAYKRNHMFIKYRKNNKVTSMIQINTEDIEKIHYYA